MRKEQIYQIFSHMPSMESARLLLRPLHVLDAEDMYDYARREDVTTYLLWLPHPSISYTRDYLSYIEERYLIGEFYDWAVVEKASGKMIGTCGFTRIDAPHNAAEIGYVLNPDFHGKGYGTEALRLILADLGVDTALKATDKLRKAVREQHLKTPEEAKAALKDILEEMLNVGDVELNLSTNPSVILVIGVNGVGKTTTIGKIATRLVKEGKKVLLVAGDTFRAAAADQLEIWAGRSGADIVRQHEGADPASVVFDGIQAARARDVDVIIIDTAGRLHNKTNLMNELNKISRIVERELPNAAREVLLVLDGTTGQNGLIQAKQFKEIAGVTAIALTKLDGTAKGGIVIAVADSLQIPVKFVGVGEQADDLMPFEARNFVEALIQ